jgi:hypothetical protein
MPEPRIHPVTVTARPDGADLTVGASHYEHLVKDLFGLLGEQPELWDDLCDLIEGDAPVHDPHLPDRSSRDDALAARLVAALPVASRTIRVHRGPLTQLLHNLGAVLRPWTHGRSAA